MVWGLVCVVGLLGRAWALPIPTIQITLINGPLCEVEMSRKVTMPLLEILCVRTQYTVYRIHKSTNYIYLP